MGWHEEIQKIIEQKVPRNHIIDKNDIHDFIATTRLAAQHGKGVNKILEMNVIPVDKRIWFTVSSKRVELYSGPSLEDAINIYNNIIGDR